MQPPYDLKPINKELKIDFSKFDKELILARTEIGILKGACYGLPNPQLLLSPTVMREALASSEIENIITTLADVLQAQLFSEAEQGSQDREVLRYSRALSIGLDLLAELPIGSRVIRDVHDVLIPDEKDYRKIQNALINGTTKEVVYMPPAANKIPGLITDLQKFVYEEDGIDPLLKTIVAHYQFEAIHPFGDGNGRTGRILMVLCLKNFELLELPVLFISGYINTHKDEYYSAIRGVTDNGDWDTFIHYMLKAFTEQAKDSTTLLLKIKDLHEKVKREIRKELPKIYSRDLVDAIFSQPFITPKRYGELLGVTYQTGSSHLKSLEKNGFMESLKVGKYLLFANKPLLSLLHDA
ncbi:MAG: Fic family protein [Candidatus Saccharibacteria bacterium]